jgi:Na+-translocating ferredoxin:NAD+ oxidoreductase RnfE subunit
MDPLAIGRQPVTVYLDAQLYARLKAQAHGCGACLQGYVVGAIRDRVDHSEIVQGAKQRLALAAQPTP